MLTIGEYDSHPRVRRQAEALVARGDQVTVLALHAPGRPARERVDGVDVVRLPVHKYRGTSARAYLGLYGGFAARAAAWAMARLRRFDLIQVNTMPEALVFSTALQRLSGVPILLDVHDRTAELFASKFRQGGRLMSAIEFSERAALRFATEVLTVHEPYAQTLREMTRRTVTVVMNCPDERVFATRDWKDWAPGGAIGFGYHGLIAPRHNLVGVVEALAEVRKDVPQARVHLWGSGDGVEGVTRRVEELGVQDAVYLPKELVPITQIPRELDAVHVGLVPSMRDAWTDRVLPTKLLEYAAMGIPVITFRNPVIEENFPDDSVTYVDPSSAETLREAMLSLAFNPERARKQATRALEVMTSLTWNAQKQVYFEVIDRLAAGRKR